MTRGADVAKMLLRKCMIAQGFLVMCSATVRTLGKDAAVLPPLHLDFARAADTNS